MKTKLIFIALLGLTIYSCGENGGANGNKPSKETLKKNIRQMEDSLKQLTATLTDIKQIPNLTRIELINRYLEFYKNYPEDSYAPECLDKVHMVYSGMNVHMRSAQYADTLLTKYPEYVNRAMVLESQGSNYDIFIQPRDSAKVRYYYQLLLKENPTLDKDKKKGIQERLKFNHLNFDQYLEKKMNEMVSK
ncbi:MAG: hypothetical protein ACK45H_00165 [Bacteroidota bacterium]|jgi:hypothetical protein